MGKKKAEDRRAARGEGGYRGSRSHSRGSYKKGGRRDIGQEGFKHPI